MIKKHIIIAGPCSAESREQVLQTAKELSENGFNLYRAGIWKPRTKPGGFEGIGEPALKWLNEVQEKYDMMVGCEVGNADQCKLAMDYHLDFIWIGARTSADPFAVQQIADVISSHPYKENTIVMVKNPVCPDYDLWLGAIQRIQNAHPFSVTAIFRGFKTYTKTKYRNQPIWEIPIKMMSEHPEIAMYLDPSHIAGDTAYIKELMDIGHNQYGIGSFMVESHCNPKEAITDASQQVTPSKLDSIIREINMSHIVSDDESDSSYIDELNSLRKKIDNYDKELLQLLVNRLKVCRKIGEIKKENKIPTYQRSRWNEVLSNIKDDANNVLNCHHELDYFIDNLWNLIHTESIDIQNKEFTNIR